MRRLKLYTWSLIAILAVILLASELSIDLEKFIMVKLAAMAVLLVSGYQIRHYTDIMDKDIDILENFIKVDDSEREESKNHDD